MTSTEQRKLKIKQLSGPEIHLTLPSPDILISELKALISEQNGMAPAQQRLIYKARALPD